MMYIQCKYIYNINCYQCTGGCRDKLYIYTDTRNLPGYVTAGYMCYIHYTPGVITNQALLMRRRQWRCGVLSSLVCFLCLYLRLYDLTIIPFTTSFITLWYIFNTLISGYYATPVLSWTSTNVNWILTITTV